jgi:hypothetical protein
MDSNFTRIPYNLGYTINQIKLEHLQEFGKTTPYLNFLAKRKKSLLQQFGKRAP